MLEEIKYQHFVKKIQLKYEWVQNETINKLSNIFLDLLKKEEKRISSTGLRISDEPFELLKQFNEIFLNTEFKSNVLLKFLCIYDPSIKETFYPHINFLIEEILKEEDYPFTNIGNPLAQEKIFKIAFKVHNIGKLLIPKVLFDKNIVLEDVDRILIEKQVFYTKEILEDMNFGKHVLDICLDTSENVNECYLSDMKKCNVSKPSRIILILDKYFALISDKPYRKGYSKKEAIDIISHDISMDEYNTRIVDIIRNSIK